MSVESARPGRGGQRDTKVAEKGSSETTANPSGFAPFTRNSNRERMRVSRTNRPSADGVRTSPSGPLMLKVDSSTRVTAAPDGPKPATLPLKVHGSLTRGTLPDGRGLLNTLVGAVLGIGTAVAPGGLPARDCHYGRSENLAGTVHSGRDPASGDRGPARGRRGCRDPARGGPGARGGRAACPHGTERLGQVDTGEHPSRKPRLPGDRRLHPLPG